MPKAQTNISADTKRSILQHLMFGMLGVLILMNWTVHWPLDYKDYEEAFAKINVGNERYLQQQLDWFTDDDLNSEKYRPIFKAAQEIKDSSECVINEIIKVRRYLSNNRISRKEEIIHLLDLLKKVNELRISFLRAVDSYENSPVSYFLMNNQSELGHYLNISRCNFILQSYTKSSILSMLSALQNNVQNDRQLMLEILRDKIHTSCGWGFFGYRAVRFCNNSIIFNGDTAKVEISLMQNVDFSRRFSDVIVDRGNIDFSELPSQNFAIWEDRATVLGENTINGLIKRILDKDTITRPFSFSYFVSAPGIAFHLDKANVCYVGVPNPISISVPGYPADKINLKVAGAKVSKIEDGQFEIFFSKIPSAKVYAYVEATNEQGRTSTVHSMELKVKEFPAPTTNLSSFKESGISLEELKILKSIKVQPVDSVFDLEYEVIRFQVEGITHDGKYIEPITVHGDELSGNQELNSVFKTTVSGDRFIFSHIHAKATNGKEYEALPVSLLLK